MQRRNGFFEKMSVERAETVKKILLASMDKNYLAVDSTLNSSHISPYDQAVKNLNEDICQWSEGSGVEAQLISMNVIDHEYEVGAKITRERTQLYALVDHDEHAWFTMMLGSIEPSTRLTHNEDRGWCFAWNRNKQ